MVPIDIMKDNSLDVMNASKLCISVSKGASATCLHNRHEFKETSIFRIGYYLLHSVVSPMFLCAVPAVRLNVRTV